MWATFFGAILKDLSLIPFIWQTQICIRLKALGQRGGFESVNASRELLLSLQQRPPIL